MRMRALCVTLFLAACGSGRPAARPAVTLVASAPPKVARAPSPAPSRKAKFREVLAEYRRDPPAAAAELLDILCGDPIDSASSLDKSCEAATRETAFAWVLLGDLAQRGQLPRFLSDAESLAIADAAYVRALQNLNGADNPLYTEALYDLAFVRMLEQRYAQALSGFLEVVEDVDLDRARDLAGTREVALHWATNIIVNDRDWDGDGRDDPTQGLDRPEVKKRLELFSSPGSRADFYARLVATALAEDPQSYPFVTDCALANRALKELRALAPTDSRLPALSSKVAACH